MKPLKVEVISGGTLRGKTGTVLNVETEGNETYVNVIFRKDGIRRYFNPNQLKVLK